MGYIIWAVVGSKKNIQAYEISGQSLSCPHKRRFFMFSKEQIKKNFEQFAKIQKENKAIKKWLCEQHDSDLEDLGIKRTLVTKKELNDNGQCHLIKIIIGSGYKLEKILDMPSHSGLKKKLDAETFLKCEKHFTEVSGTPKHTLLKK